MDVSTLLICCFIFLPSTSVQDPLNAVLFSRSSCVYLKGTIHNKQRGRRGFFSFSGDRGREDGTEDVFGEKKGASFSVESLTLVTDIATTGVRFFSSNFVPTRVERQSWHVASWEECRGLVAVQCGEDHRRPRSGCRICTTIYTTSQPGNLLVQVASISMMMLRSLGHSSS